MACLLHDEGPADGADSRTPPTIDDSSTLDGNESALRALGYPKVASNV